MSIKIAVAAVIVAALVILGCGRDGQSYEVKNKALEQEISWLQQEMTVRNLTGSDTVNMLRLSRDPVELFYAKEFAWLVGHNESEHYNHPLTFLDWYVRTGEDNFCAPHALGHLASYIREGDIAYAGETVAAVRQKLPLWEGRQESSRQKYPQFYQKVGELKAMMREAIARLDARDYGNETLGLLGQIDSNSVC